MQASDLDSYPSQRRTAGPNPHLEGALAQLATVLIDIAVHAGEAHRAAARGDSAGRPAHAEPGARLLVTVAEAARMVSVSRTKMYQLVAGGTVPSVRLGRLLRIRIADLEAIGRVSA